MGRRPLGKVAMSVAERSRRHRLKHARTESQPQAVASIARSKRTYRHATVCPHRD